MMIMIKLLKGCSFPSHRDIKHSIGNIVNNILITMYGVRYKIYQDDHLVSYIMSNYWGVHLKHIICQLYLKNLKND